MNKESIKNCPNCHEEVPGSYEICWNCLYHFKTKVIVQEFIEISEVIEEE